MKLYGCMRMRLLHKTGVAMRGPRFENTCVGSLENDSLLVQRRLPCAQASHLNCACHWRHTAKKGTSQTFFCAAETNLHWGNSKRRNAKLFFDQLTVHAYHAQCV